VTIKSLLQAIETFRLKEQPEWFGHIYPHGRATARLARYFAATYSDKIRGATLDEIECGAQLHDIGKFLISKEILLKPSALDKDERAIMSYHPIYGAQILHNLSCATTTIIQIVRYHHEKRDGTGYPEGLSGDKIPFATRIVTIADIYVSLRVKRPYKRVFTREEAYIELEKMAVKGLDPNLVSDFLKFVKGRAYKRECVQKNEEILQKNNINLNRVLVLSA
jgi:HD-GYP domain-containing protein (c-di-GMP phosphodiesterase class II)